MPCFIDTAFGNPDLAKKLGLERSLRETTLTLNAKLNERQPAVPARLEKEKELLREKISKLNSDLNELKKSDPTIVVTKNVAPKASDLKMQASWIDTAALKKPNGSLANAEVNLLGSAHPTNKRMSNKELLITTAWHLNILSNLSLDVASTEEAKDIARSLVPIAVDQSKKIKESARTEYKLAELLKIAAVVPHNLTSFKSYKIDIPKMYDAVNNFFKKDFDLFIDF